MSGPDPRLARRLVGDPAAADDLAQETWLAAFTRAPAEVRSWRAWLGESARRLASRERRGAGQAATTASDGSFDFGEVSAGERWLVVEPAAGRLRILENGAPVVGRIGFSLAGVGSTESPVRMLNPFCDGSGVLALEFPARGAFWADIAQGPLFSRQPAPIDFSLGDQELRCELRTGTLVLLLPETLVAEEGSQFHLRLRRPEAREASLAVRVFQGSLVDDDRLHLGDLATRRCRIEHVPEGPLEITLAQEGRSLGSTALVVPAGGEASGVLR